MVSVEIEARFTSLFEDHYNEVLAYCARRSNRSDADDAAAEVFAVAWRRIEDIDWETARPWLYGVARGLMSNRLRSVKRQGRLATKMASLAPPSADDPDVVVVRRSEDEEVVSVLQQLSQRDQEILMLAAWEELSAPEIAVVLEISTSAAEQRLHRAKKRFAKRLERKNPKNDRQFGSGSEGAL